MEIPVFLIMKIRNSACKISRQRLTYSAPQQIMLYNIIYVHMGRSSLANLSSDLASYNLNSVKGKS